MSVELTCEWCGDTFTRSHSKGPVPKFCRPSHRQRSYERRKDKRLQAVADAPKCKHELIDRHGGPVLNADLTQKRHPNGALVWKWCEGAPELRAAIKALTKENNND